MTRTMIVVAHPRPDSFSHAMADQARLVASELGSSVDWHDLYAEGFDPVLPAVESFTSGNGLPQAFDSSPDTVVQHHREDLGRADVLVVAHPNWWGKPPAIMAGWLDRVLVPGVAYSLDSREGVPIPLLHLRSAVVLNTGDTPEEREQHHFGDPLDLIWRQCVGSYLGEAEVQRRLFGPMAEADDAQRRGWLDTVGDLVREALGAAGDTPAVCG